MSLRHALLSALPLLLAAGMLAAAEPRLVTPDRLDWKAGGAPGMSHAAVDADVAAGVTVRRVRLERGARMPPHGHAQGYRLVTVLEGTLYLGFGDRFDAAALRALPAGSSFREPHDAKHFVEARDGAVVLQLVEVGPHHE